MNRKWLKVGLLCAVLGLAACKSNNDGSTTSPAIVSANTGTMTITTSPNSIVSIGASGTNYKVADATGKAVFTGLAPGAVDVHVFSADGYSATSYMGLNAENISDNLDLFDVPFYNYHASSDHPPNAVIDLYAHVVNHISDISFSDISLTLVTADGYYRGSISNQQSAGGFGFEDMAVGTTLSGTLYAARGSAVSTAGSSVWGWSEVVNLGEHSFITTDWGGAYAFQAYLTVNFAETPPPVPPPLVTIVATPPVGLGIDFVSFGSSGGIETWGLVPRPLVISDTIKAQYFGNDTSFVAVATDGAFNQRWSYYGTFEVGGTVNVEASFTVPTIATNQTGNVISWTHAADALTLNGLMIGHGLIGGWQIYTAGAVSSITLPTVPDIVTSPLVAVKRNSIYLTSLKDASGRSFEQALAFYTSGGVFTGEKIECFFPYTH